MTQPKNELALTPLPTISTPIQKNRKVVAIGSVRIGAIALGAAAIGALAFGAVAVGAVAIARLRIGKARIGKLRIDELEVGRLVLFDDENVRSEMHVSIPNKPDLPSA